MGRLLKPIFILALALAAGMTLVKYLSANSQFKPKDSNSKVERSKTGDRDTTAFVSALGHLEPASKVLDLAAPTQATDVQPRIASIEVQEGQNVRKGQVLAIFDTKERLTSEKQAILSHLSSVQGQVKMLEQETSRFRTLVRENAYPKSELEAKELKLMDLKSEAIRINSDLEMNQVNERISTLVSPISGRVLKIDARAGERPNPYGMIKVGETDNMTAIAQVDEQNIGKISLGQKVSIRSENRSFAGNIYGRVKYISLMVGARKNLSINPKAESDTETRTIDVEIKINPEYNDTVSNLTGTKIIATFQ